jgi:hypothetical protein
MDMPCKRADIFTVVYEAVSEPLARQEQKHDSIKRAEDGFEVAAECWNDTTKTLTVVYHRHH